MNIKRIFYYIFTFLLSLLLCSCMYEIGESGGTSSEGNSNGEQNSEYTYYSGYFSSMGTVITLGVFTTTQAEATAIYNDIKEIYDLYDSISDDGYDSIYGQSYDSELAQLNRDRSMVVSNELYELLEFAVYLMEYTDGYFNPFMGELNHEWKDYINFGGNVPSNVECEFFSTIARNTYLEFGENNLVTICNDVTENSALIDLGGIAKGYATNKAYEYFLENNIEYYLLNAGSSNILTGSRPDDSEYSIVLSYVYGYSSENPVIQIIDNTWYIDGRNTGLSATSGANSYYSQEAPSSDIGSDGDLYMYFGTTTQAIYIKENGSWRNKLNMGILNFTTTDMAIVTSSPSEQNRNGYHHLISPYGGEPVNYVDSVTVFGTDSGMLDALSTALFVMPDDVREAFILEHDLKVIIVKDETIIYKNIEFNYEI